MTPCPCGSGQAFTHCCEPALDGTLCGTAEALMRSRYCAYVRGDENHLFRTWHPRTRPHPPYCNPQVQWTGLKIVDIEGGGDTDDEGIVEFVASWEMRSDEGGARSGGGGAAGSGAGRRPAGARSSGAAGPGSGATAGARRASAAGQRGQLHERSRFTRRAGRWVYVDGDQ